MVFLGLRVLLLALAANQGNPFVDFVYAIGGFFSAPFTGIFGSPSYGQFFFDTASVVAIVVYALVAWGLVKLVTLTRPQDEV
ncbi:YggT family protein [Candidatus Nomurabacteria bacterium]|nr:YggT family protein [Candidatus Nomurabacteria bacterium]